MKRLIALALAAVLTGVLITRAGATTAPTVAYIGDSTMTDEIPYLPAGANVEAYPGIDIATAYQNLAASIQANPPGVAVVSLGLNDQEQGLGFLSAVEQMVELFPVSTKVIWIQPVVAPWAAWPWYVTPTVVTEKAQAVDYVASLHPNMVVLGWTPLPDWYRTGGTHFTDVGNQYRADAIQAEVNKAGA